MARIANTVGGATVGSHGYTYDALNRRTRATLQKKPSAPNWRKTWHRIEQVGCAICTATQRGDYAEELRLRTRLHAILKEALRLHPDLESVGLRIRAHWQTARSKRAAMLRHSFDVATARGDRAERAVAAAALAQHYSTIKNRKHEFVRWLDRASRLSVGVKDRQLQRDLAKLHDQRRVRLPG